MLWETALLKLMSYSSIRRQCGSNPKTAQKYGRGDRVASCKRQQWVGLKDQNRSVLVFEQAFFCTESSLLFKQLMSLLSLGCLWPSSYQAVPMLQKAIQQYLLQTWVPGAARVQNLWATEFINHKPFYKSLPQWAVGAAEGWGVHTGQPWCWWP